MTQQERIEKAAREFVESVINQMDDSAYSMHEKKRMTRFTGGDLEEYLVSFAEKLLQNQWISVDDKLPKDDKCVFAMFDDGRIIVAKYEDENWWWQDGFVVGRNTKGDLMYSSSVEIPNTEKITHWMPIPQLKGE